MCIQIENISENVSKDPAISEQQSQTNEFLLSINQNLQKLIEKVERTNTLLAVSLNLEE